MFSYSFASADGGPVLSDPEVWAMLSEGQQIAVVRLDHGEVAHVDLFITLLDRGDVSHRITFFVPLGVQARDFELTEQTQQEFDTAETADLDDELNLALRWQESYARTVQSQLMLGTLPANGVAAAYALLSYVLPFGMMAGGIDSPPLASFETEHSTVWIYAIDQQTDLDVLIQTTGLDAGVRETLRRLQGQQVAILRLRTQPAPSRSSDSPQYNSEPQPGIHLSWDSQLVAGDAGDSYAYPLGTGKAWAHPIELTRVYVVAPPGLDFNLEYPRLGKDFSGETGSSSSFWRLMNLNETGSAAYAIDEAVGSFGHIWRGFYLQSNPEQDIQVTRLLEASPETNQALRTLRFHDFVRKWTWLFALVGGGMVWVFTWKRIIGSRLNITYRYTERKLWIDSFTWSLVYLGLIIAMGLLFLGLLMTGLQVIALAGGVLLLLAAFGLANAFIYAREQARAADGWGRAFGYYLLVILVANLIYLPFALIYLLVVGVV
jgi:hypothetical protein